MIEPCGTPVVVLTIWDRHSSSATNCLRSETYRMRDTSSDSPLLLFFLAVRRCGAVLWWLSSALWRRQSFPPALWRNVSAETLLMSRFVPLQAARYARRLAPVWLRRYRHSSWRLDRRADENNHSLPRRLVGHFRGASFSRTQTTHCCSCSVKSSTSNFGAVNTSEVSMFQLARHIVSKLLPIWHDIISQCVCRAYNWCGILGHTHNVELKSNKAKQTGMNLFIDIKVNT